MYKCKICGKEFKIQQAQASHVFHYHSSNETKQKAKEKQSKTTKLKIIDVNKICQKCGKTFTIQRKIRKDGTYSKSQEGSNYCSRSCANSHVVTEETKEKIRQTLTIEKKLRYCLDCGKEINLSNKYDYCHKCLYKQDFYKEIISKATKGKTGGYNEGSVRSYRSGRYNNIWFDSSWELAYYLYITEHNINIKRNSKGFDYEYEGKMHKYYPDFIVEGSYIEIKGREQPETEAKLNQFPHKIEILRRKEMKSVLQYIENKYGKKFWLQFYK